MNHAKSRNSHSRPRLRDLGLAAVALGLAALAGCTPNAEPATIRDLKLTLVATPPATGGLPDSIRVVVENSSQKEILFVVPQPLCPRSGEMPAPLVGLGFEGCKQAYWPGYADLEAKRAPSTKTVVLAPGQTWTQDFAVKNFLFLDPQDPVCGAKAADLYKPGGRELQMYAFLVIDASKAMGVNPGEILGVESQRVKVRCAVDRAILETGSSR